MRLAAALALALILAAHAAAASRSTHVTVFRPFVNGTLSAKLHVTKTAKGQCYSGSSADPRHDAWRCAVGNVIYDPCFSNSKIVSWVACPADGSPFGSGVIRVALSRALPKSLGNHGLPGQGNPWAVKLANEKVCTFLTGATFVYHGKRVNYGCTAKVFLAGSPNRSGATWTITLGKGPKARPQTAQILAAAW